MFILLTQHISGITADEVNNCTNCISAECNIHHVGTVDDTGSNDAIDGGTGSSDDKNAGSSGNSDFQNFHSTTHAIHDSIDFIKQSHSKSRHVRALFIDLSKAFDTIDHKILMHKLYNYGIRGLPYELILSYLSNHFQCTKFNSHTPDKEKVVYGVPQGSVLGPLLFLLYINDIQNCNMDANIKFVLYADDTNVFIASDTIEKCIEKANYVLASIQKYMSSNLLHINLDKCCYMWFKYNKCWSHIAPFSRLYLVKVVV